MEHVEKRPTSQKLWTRDFIAITIVNLLIFLGFQLFPSALPLYASELGAPDSLLGWITGLTTISALLIRPFSGALLDRFGRRIILLVGIVAMILTSFSFVFFPFVLSFLVLRFIQGLSWGVANTAASTVASDVVPRTRFGEGIGFFSLSGSLALAVAPALAITIFYAAGMKVTALLATGVLTIAFIIALTLKCYRSGTKPEGGSRVKLIERASILPSCIVFFVTATYGAIVTFVAIYAAQKGIDNIGLFFTVYAVALIISRPAFGRLVDTDGVSFAVLPGLAFLFMSMVLLSLAHSLLSFLACAALYGIGQGATQSGLQTLALNSVPGERRGAANATFFTGFDAGIGLGSIASGFVAVAFGYSSLFLIYAALPLIGGLIFVAAQFKERRSRESD